MRRFAWSFEAVNRFLSVPIRGEFMMTPRSRLVLLASALALAAASAGCGQPAPAAPPADDLAARVKALEDLIPDQAHIMADVADHFANLYFAGRAANWPLADFYLSETRSHLRWAVRRIPVRKDTQGRDVVLGNILEAFENSHLKPLKGSIDGKDAPGFEQAYKVSLTGCYSCHKAADKPFLRPRVPAEPASPIVNFDPKADWPL
jgi:hypothetical protein